jgi:ectoine hydroxylase-related dioxygenase (phytanoyl-CoA dioxygenase family)
VGQARSDDRMHSRLTEQLDEQGYVILRGLVEPQVVAEARADIGGLVDELAAGLIREGQVQSSFSEEPFETRIYQLYRNCLDRAPQSFRRELHLPGIFGYFFHPGLLGLVESVLGGEIRLYPNYTVRPKLPDWEGTRIWWHQDGGYTHFVHTDDSVREDAVEELRMLNVWSPLVPAREENGCMQFVPGSHKLGVVPHVSRRYYLEIVDPRYTPLFEKAVSIELNPGDVALFSNLLFHQGLPNRSPTVRWNLDWRYQDARQPTLRRDQGHIARSRSNPGRVVQSAGEWAGLEFR